MASAFDAVLPLIEDFKVELGKLDKATKEIEKARANAALNQSSANAAVEAAQKVTGAHEKLMKLLGEQQLGSLHDQTAQLQTHLDELTQRTSAETAQQLTSLKQAGQAAQTTIDKLLAQQPELLTAIKEQHAQGVTAQQVGVQKAAQVWATLLHEQMQTELKTLRQAIETLQNNTRKQHDDLSAITNQLQVATGRITAFAEAMNAAKFLTKLETIETSQRETLQNLAVGHKVHSAALGKLEDANRQHQQSTEAGLLGTNQQLTTLAQQLAAAEEQRAADQRQVLAALHVVSANSQAATKQLRLLQLLGVVASAVVGMLVYVWHH